MACSVNNTAPAPSYHEVPEEPDVLVICAAPNGGPARALLAALGRCGFSCRGEQSAAALGHAGCRCALLVLGVEPAPARGRTLDDWRGHVDRALADGVPLRCLYESSPHAWRDLADWRTACPAAFRRPAVAISQYFSRDSERSALAAVLEELGEGPPSASDVQSPQCAWAVARGVVHLGHTAKVRPGVQLRGPHADEADGFARLAGVPGVLWFASQDLLSLDSGLRLGVPLTVERLRRLQLGRPVYVSYSPEQPSDLEPSWMQLAQLRKALQRLPAPCAVALVDRQVDPRGLPDRAAAGAMEFVEVLLLSRVVVLDGAEAADAEHDALPLGRGQSFVEAAIAVLTGQLVPVRSTQLQELDLALGSSLTPGAALSQLVRMGGAGMVDRLCALAHTKSFESLEERAWWGALFRAALERHPLLQAASPQGTAGQHFPTLPSCSFDRMASESASITSFQLAIPDLLESEYVAVKVSSCSDDIVSRSTARGWAMESRLVDWARPGNQRRLKEICKLTRSLFQAFDGPAGVPGDAVAETSISSAVPRGRLALLRRVVASPCFAAVSATLTTYALFGPNLTMLAGFSAMDTDEVAAVNTVVLVLFALEVLLNSVAVQGYRWSTLFWLDCLATASFIGDTSIARDLIPDDASTTARGPRMLRIVRSAGRSSKLVGLLKSVRLLRVVRVLSIADVLVWRGVLRPHEKLARLLFHKRMWRVFQDLDADGGDRLSPEEVEMFSMAMQIEFPTPREAAQEPPRFGKSMRRSKTSQSSGALTPVSSTFRALTARSLGSEQRASCDGTFTGLIRDFMARPEGRRALDKCSGDVRHMKASCSLVRTVAGPLALKMSLVALAILAVLPIFDSPTSDQGDLQELVQLDGTATLADEGLDLCSLVRDYAQRSRHRLVLLSLAWAGPVWRPGCQCCESAAGATGSAAVASDSIEHVVQAAMESTGLQPHELKLYCYPKDDCVSLQSVALFDEHRWVRRDAVDSIVYTLLVVVLLVMFSMYFTTQFNKVNQSMLYPLWSTLDDMASLQSLEVVRMARFQPASKQLCAWEGGGSGRACPGSRFLPQWLAGRCSAAPGDELEEDPTELLELRAALTRMRFALRSWAKYVPPHLLKALYRAGVEAKIAVRPCTVSILFCDIEGFEGLCKDLTPSGVLQLLSRVHGAVSDAIDGAGGTLLEFVGDEVLAVFNAPVELPAYRACTTAALVEICECARLLGVRLRCAAHTAQVLVGNIGSPTRIKYGVLGDGVNLSARLKSLNAQYGTQCLASEQLLDFEGAHDTFLTRPVGHLVLKGRTSPTKVWEVAGLRSTAGAAAADAVDRHSRAFELYLGRRFAEARRLFAESRAAFAAAGELEDGPSGHFVRLCDRYLREPPPEDWDGSEVLGRK